MKLTATGLMTLTIVGVCLGSPLATAAEPDSTAAASPDKQFSRHHGHIVTSSHVNIEKRPYYGLMIQRMTIVDEWNCKFREHRTARRIFYTDEERFVYSEATRDPWRIVAADSPFSVTLDLVCQNAQEAIGLQ